MSIVNSAGGEERKTGKSDAAVSRLWDDESARIWNEIMDEMWSFDPNEARLDGYSFDFLDSDPDQEYKDPDDGLTEEDLIEHNISPCN